MTFDNSKTIISLRIKLFGATVILLAYLGSGICNKDDKISSSWNE